MNEELLSLALLYRTGFDTAELFEENLNRIFLENPQNKDLLELECMSFRDAVIYVSEHFEYSSLNEETLSRTLIRFLNLLRPEQDTETFVLRLGELWEVLPFHTTRKDSPFYMIYYFEDMLAAGKTDLLRTCIEDLLTFYDESNHP